MYCSFNFFSFRITQTSVNTNVLEQSPEVHVNAVLLYLVQIIKLLVINSGYVLPTGSTQYSKFNV